MGFEDLRGFSGAAGTRSSRAFRKAGVYLRNLACGKIDRPLVYGRAGDELSGANGTGTSARSAGAAAFFIRQSVERAVRAVAIAIQGGANTQSTI